MKSCPKCGSMNSIRRGGRRFQCKDCGKYYSDKDGSVRGRASFFSKGDTAELTDYSTIRITSLDELVAFCNIDLVEWKVDRWVCNKWEVGAKNTDGDVVVQPLFQVKVWLVRRVQELIAMSLRDELVADAKKFAPKYKAIRYPKHADGYLYEIAMPDLQLGRLVMEEEAGINSSPDSYAVRATTAVNELMMYVRNYPIERIVLPVGNDFFDANTAEGMTAHGTPQRDDVRWQRTFRIGRSLMVNIIDTLSGVAPVDVIIVPGNHDEERIFYLGEALLAWYHNHPNVAVDNLARKRKYYSFGKCLLGLTHGYYEKLDALSALMPYEVPEAWAASTCREYHLGDKHHKRDMILKTQEMSNGVVVRVLRSLATPSVWEFDKGFVGTPPAAEGFLWHPSKGVVGQFTSFP